MNKKEDDYKYHCIYSITNTVNKKMYIGKHSTNNLDDNYMGSGTLIKKAIKKYGKQNFIKEIIFIYHNVYDALKKEREIITQDIIESQDYYNLKGGGIGGHMSTETRKNISEALLKSKWRQKLTPEQEIILNCKHKESRIKNGTLWKNGSEHPMYGKEVSIEIRSKISKSLLGNIPALKNKTYEEFYGEERAKEIKAKVGRDTSGNKNPCFGRVWLKLNNHKVYPIKNSSEYHLYISKGYIQDSSVCVTTDGFVWIKNDDLKLRTFINKNDEDYNKMINLNFYESRGCHLDKNLIGLNKKIRKKFLNENNK